MRAGRRGDSDAAQNGLTRQEQMDEPREPAEHAGLDGGDVVIGEIERLDVRQPVHEVRRDRPQVVVAQIELR